jgi:hypothetical protein
MKKTVLSLMMLSSLFSQEVIENKVFSKVIKSEDLSSNLTVTIEDEKISNLIIKIDGILNKVHSTKICKNSEYSVMPKYEYKNGKREASKYKTNLLFKCQFPQAKINIFSKLLDELQFTKNLISINKFTYIVPDKLRETSLENMKIKAFEYGNEKSVELSKKLKMRCFIKDVSFQQKNNYPSYSRYNKVMSEAVSVPLPLNKGHKLELNTNYKFICF